MPVDLLSPLRSADEVRSACFSDLAVKNYQEKYNLGEVEIREVLANIHPILETAKVFMHFPALIQGRLREASLKNR